MSETQEPQGGDEQSGDPQPEPETNAGDAPAPIDPVEEAKALLERLERERNEAPELGSKVELLAKKDLGRKRVYVHYWRSWVWLKTMTGEERDAFEVSCLVEGKMSYENVRAKLLVHAIVDAKGERIFANGDWPELTKKSGAALGVLYNEATKLNAITEADVEELVKNSGRGTTATS